MTLTQCLVYGTNNFREVQPTIGRQENDDGRSINPAVSVKQVASVRELNAVYRLTHDAYVWRGYCEPKPDGRLIHYPHLDNIPQTTVFVAVDDTGIVGTASYTIDGPQGLHVDLDFGEVCDTIRAENRRLSASWRIATHHSCRITRKVSMLLMGKVALLFVRSEADVLLCTFNPRHEAFYERIFNFKTISRSASDARGLQGAPAILMRVDKEDFPKKWWSSEDPTPDVQASGSWCK